MKYRSFKEARNFVRSLKLKSNKKWRVYCKSGKRPFDVPTNPDKIYKKEWKNWGDWFGTGYVSTSRRKFWPYEDAKTFVRELGIKTGREWIQHAKSGKLPAYVPKSPHMAYNDKGWAGYGDWLGTGTIAHRKRRWRPFREARAFVRSLNLTVGWRESHYRLGRSRRGINLTVVWREYCKSGERPVNIPTDPARIYKDQGWAGIRDWLGK